MPKFISGALKWDFSAGNDFPKSFLPTNYIKLIGSVNGIQKLFIF